MTVRVAVRAVDAGWLAEVTVAGPPLTKHVVRVSRAERERYGGADVGDLVRHSFAFLLAREPHTSILPEFTLTTVERYFPDFAREFPR